MNTKLLWTLVLCLLISLASSSVAAERYYVIDLTNQNGQILFNGLKIEELGDITLPTSGTFSISTISFAGIAGEPQVYDFSSPTTHKAFFPYSAQASALRIKNPQGQVVLTIDVGHFGQSCGDSLCQPQESYESCPADCQSGGADDICDELQDGVCDPDCPAVLDLDCEQPESVAEEFDSLPEESVDQTTSTPFIEQPTEQSSGGGLLWFILFFIVVLSGGGIFLLSKGGEDKKIKEYIQYYRAQGYPPQAIYQGLNQTFKNREKINLIYRQEFQIR